MIRAHGLHSWFLNTILVLVFLCLGCSKNADVPNGPTPGTPAAQSNSVTSQDSLPKELVTAWTNAGAKVGWMSDDRERYVREWFREGPERQKGELPAFRFSGCSEG